MMPRPQFEALVESALKSLPPRFRNRLKNLAVLIEDWPQASRGRMILGLYHGVPYPHRGPFYGNVGPDVIIIYQGPIEAVCSSEEEVKTKVREVVLHEIGHYFGLDEAQLRSLEKSANKPPRKKRGRANHRHEK